MLEMGYERSLRFGAIVYPGKELNIPWSTSCSCSGMHFHDANITCVSEEGSERELERRFERLGEDVRPTLHTALHVPTGREGLHEHHV